MRIATITISRARRADPGRDASPGERIRPELELDHLARRARPRLHMERGARADRGPQASSLPSRGGVVDAAVHPLGEEAHRIGHAQYDPTPVVEREQALG